MIWNKKTRYQNLETKMIQPVNNHLLIEPVKQSTIIPIDGNNYQEIGIVIDADVSLMMQTQTTSYSSQPIIVNGKINKGDKVYFDAWLAAKYPKEGTDEFYWLVKWEDVRAIEHVEIPEQPMQ